jgi:hypothetical protein
MDLRIQGDRFYFEHLPPMRLTGGLYKNNPSCATAKLDLWFEGGRYSKTLFMMGAGPGQDSKWMTDESGMVLHIGDYGCRIRIRIERAD